MKKIFTPINIQALLLLLMSIAETVVMILFKPFSIGLILTIQFIAILCIVCIRFSYHIPYLGNRWHSYWKRKHSDKENDEPSSFAIGITKALGYTFLLVLQLIMFL